MANQDANKYLAQLKMFEHRSSPKAVLMSLDNNRDNGVWLPRSQIASMTPTDRRWQFTVTMSEWLAIKNKLV